VESRSFLIGYDDNHAVEDVVIEGLTIGGKPVVSADEGKFVLKHAKQIRFVESARSAPRQKP